MAPNILMGRDNELRVLQAVGLIGWLSASQVARWVWGSHNTRSARVSAEKVLKRLRSSNQLARRKNAVGVFVYILTKNGAVRANETVRTPLFRDGYSLSHLDVGRQAPAVEYLTNQYWAGKTVFGAAAIRKAISEGMLNKHEFTGTDGLVIDRESGERKGVLVVRNTHPQLIQKAKRITKAVDELQLLGRVGLIQAFKKEMRRG